MRFLLLLLLASLAARAASSFCDGPGEDPHWTQVLDLRGPWRFQIGDDPARASADYDHSSWETIFVPSGWEEEGYWGYDGVAWYRRTFLLTERQLRAPLYLRLGRIDDADHVWVNGRFVGSTGRFPESGYETGAYTHRVYRIPPGFLQPGENVVAVRVFDEGGEGGILEGPVGLFTLDPELPLALDLSGTWRFRPGEDVRLRTAPTDAWARVTVPAKWEPQGFPTLDGFAWYRRTFKLPDRLRDGDVVLVLGLIDDLHEVYVNGERIGGTPDIENRHVRGDEWQELRAYPLPPDLLGTTNELAIRVFDGGYDGGIYEGPVGLMTTASYERWRSGGNLLDVLRVLDFVRSVLRFGDGG